MSKETKELKAKAKAEAKQAKIDAKQAKKQAKIDAKQAKERSTTSTSAPNLRFSFSTPTRISRAEARLSRAPSAVPSATRWNLPKRG